MCSYISYSSAFLRSVRKTSRIDHSSFSLCHTLMSKIVAMGLKKQPRNRPYRMSRAGRSLLHQIERLVSKNTIGKAVKTIFGVNKNNLIEITKEATSTKFF